MDLLIHLSHMQIMNIFLVRRLRRAAIFGEANIKIHHRFSAALVDAKIDWNSEHMYEFLVNPKKYVPGTKMVFPTQLFHVAILFVDLILLDYFL